jgi:hypothetical protein
MRLVRGGASVGSIEVTHHVPRPLYRPGDLPVGWRTAFALSWMLLVAAQGVLWFAARRIGLSTWWLGAESSPRPMLVSYLPFAAPVAVIIASLRATRWLPFWGFAGTLPLAATAAGDLGRSPGAAAVEFALAASGAMVSLAALGAMFRAAPSDSTA